MEKQYKRGFSITELFSVGITGVVTARDNFVIDMDKKVLLERILDFTDISQSDEDTRLKYFGNTSRGKYLPGDTRGWSMNNARRKIKDYQHGNFIREISYRLFDNRYIYYHPAMVDWGREKIMHHFLQGNNFGLVLCKQVKSFNHYQHTFITKNLFESSLVSNKTSEICYGFPLYCYPETDQETLIEKIRIPNLNQEIINKIADGLKLQFTIEKENADNTFTSIDLLDYVYAVLYSPFYREKYKEFLKTNFPRLPYPANKNQFRNLVKLGSELRELHLLESKALNKLITTYPEAGNNKIEKISYEIANERIGIGKVKINKSQYFGKVPQSVWNFYIGGYQPAQKWLKDRKGRELTSDDIAHYRKLLKAISETEKLMEKIDREIDS